MRIALMGILFLLPGSLYGPEEVVGETPAQERREWVRFGLFGFGMRVGADLEGDGQAVGGGALDLGHVYSDRFRIRLALGFELPMWDGFSWFIEYHPQDALRRHRIFVGLSTRRRGM